VTWPRRVASELFMALLVVGPPVVLVKIVGWPLHGWPTLEQARLWVAQPLTEQTLTAALTVLAWLVGLLVVYTVTVSVLTRIRAAARWVRRMPLPTPPQATATGVAGAAVFGVSKNATTTTASARPSARDSGTGGGVGEVVAFDVAEHSPHGVRRPVPPRLGLGEGPLQSSG
jgi:hypothetical protein